MIQNIFDSHAHYDDRKFDGDREELLLSLRDSGVRLLTNIGSNLQSSARSVELSRRYDFIYAAVGVHPHDAIDVPEDYLEQLEQMAKEQKVVAIGEIGLDYYYDFSPREMQKIVFEQQLRLAKKLGLPVVIHSRDAAADTMELLKKRRPKGIVHCFSGSTETAKEVLKLGMYIGFTGVVTFKNARKTLEVVEMVPLDRMLVETDCPYMAPEPFRGKRCDSAMLQKTIEKIAEIKGISPQEVADITNRNACRAYEIG
ncbi:TatD family hydrolase [Candidatus Soleaferrea massiliensis]|uniref:TatD family hydrolase n=1 Tax=Candidatus Soleaferrea massiliensis TaxID=1470354 RepID=UPI000590DFC0|nr:TatD family hydrolase [Candidatus Soleaferrea massiliensis]